MARLRSKLVWPCDAIRSSVVSEGTVSALAWASSAEHQQPNKSSLTPPGPFLHPKLFQVGWCSKQSFLHNYPWNVSFRGPPYPHHSLSLEGTQEVQVLGKGRVQTSRTEGTEGLQGESLCCAFNTCSLKGCAQRLLPGPPNNTCSFCLLFKTWATASILRVSAFLFRET